MISIVVINKDEKTLEGTLVDLTQQAGELGVPTEIIVVDASEGRLDYIRQRHQTVRWVPFERPPKVRLSIPHQRNTGVRAAKGEIIVFIDSGGRPRTGWLERLIEPLLENGEHVTAGNVIWRWLYDRPLTEREPRYLRECSTANLAFRREVFTVVGGFDESFEYGSDIDFSWRLRDAGYRLRSTPAAMVNYDNGNYRRQLRRSYAYGKARTRLYRKHPAHRRRIIRDDPTVVVYPIFLLGLPLALRWPAYPLLLLIPAWRNRANGSGKVLANHLFYGAGVLTALVRE
jgi:glycosyltransferase involved in cell wall biosynthesis